MTTFCYCLVDRNDGRFLDMAAVSLAFLRDVQPDNAIEIVADQETYDFAKSRNHVLLREASEWRVQNCASMQPVEASRFLKINCRRFVRDDLVFLDADVVPLRRFSPSLESQTKFAIARDAWFLQHPFKWPAPPARWFDELGWTRPKTYFNSGVMWMRDDVWVEQLVEEWAAKWRDFSSRTALFIDQPALNATLASRESGSELQLLPTRWNAPITAVHDSLAGAAWLHFLSDHGKTVLPLWAKRQRESRPLSPDERAAFRRHPYPWRDAGRMRAHFQARQFGLVARALMRRKNFKAT